MVHLQKVCHGQETYYYIVHNYRNKFGRPWRRYLLRLGKNRPSDDQLPILLKKAEKWRKDHDVYETIFAQLWEKHGESGKQQFIIQVNHLFGLSEKAANNHWNETRKLYLRQSGATLQLEQPNMSPPQLQHNLTLPEEGQRLKVSVKAPLGVLRTLRRISQSYRSQIEGLRVALYWLATQLNDNYTISRVGYPKQHYRLHHKQTMQEIAKCFYFIPQEPVLHQTGFSLRKNDILWLSLIQKHLDVFSRTTAIHLTILLYGSTQGIALPLFCEYGVSSEETKYRKTYKRISCRSPLLSGRKVKPAYCLDCSHFR